MPKIARSDESGFALLEAIVALIACSLVLTLYFQIVGRSATVSQVSRDRFAAALFAQSTFDSLGTLTPLENGTTHGTFGGLFHWRLQISDETGTETQDLNAPLKPMHVALSIDWRRGARHERLDYKGLRLARRP